MTALLILYFAGITLILSLFAYLFISAAWPVLLAVAVGGAVSWRRA
jgi:hypothetical protein